MIETSNGRWHRAAAHQDWMCEPTRRATSPAVMLQMADNLRPTCAPVAQWDKALSSGAKGRRFESCRARQILEKSPISPARSLRGLDQRSAHCRACSTRRHKTFGQRRRSSGPSSVRFQGGRAGAEIEDRRYLSEIHGARMIAIRDPRTVLHVHPQRNPAIRRTPLRSSRRP